MADRNNHWSDPNEDPAHLSGTAFFAPADLALPVMLLLGGLLKEAGVRDIDGFICATQSLEDGKTVMAELVKLQEEQGIEPLKHVIAFGQTVGTFDLDHRMMTPGQTVSVATRTGDHRATQVTFLPSVKSSWWESRENIERAVITLKGLFAREIKAQPKFLPFDIQPGLLELSSRWN